MLFWTHSCKPRKRFKLSNRAAAQADARPGLAIIANVMTPYRANLHRLVAAGIPELKLHTLMTHGVGDFDWSVAASPEVNATKFSATGEHSLDNPLRRPVAEWRKAGRLIRYLKTHDVKAVVFCFYRYISYLRTMDYCYRAGIPFWVNLDSNIRNEPQLSGIQSFVKRSLYDLVAQAGVGCLLDGRFGRPIFPEIWRRSAANLPRALLARFRRLYPHDDVALERLQRKFGLDRGRRYIMYSGRLVPEKRVDLLIDAFAAIAGERPDWDLLIVGDGPLSDELRRRVPESLRSRVVWTGFLDGADNVVAFHAADVLVLPSDQEPWALVIQEAMAAGLVVVASDIVGAAHELVEDKVRWTNFRRRQPPAINSAIRDVTDPEAFDQYKTAIPGSVGQIPKKSSHPVAEIRRALSDAGVLSA